jgi:mRNA interferase RelE/StbE
VAYALKYHPLVQSEDLQDLDKKTRVRIKRAIEERLMIAPQEYGEPLRRTLKGYWKLRVGNYRVVFKVHGEEILILGILHRKEVYETVAKSRTGAVAPGREN